MLCTANSQRNRREVPRRTPACSVDGRHAVAPLPDRASGPSVSRSTNVPVSCPVCGPVEAVISFDHLFILTTHGHPTATPRPIGSDRPSRVYGPVRRDGEMETDEAAACAARARDRPRVTRAGPTRDPTARAGPTAMPAPRVWLRSAVASPAQRRSHTSPSRTPGSPAPRPNADMVTWGLI